MSVVWMTTCVLGTSLEFENQRCPLTSFVFACCALTLHLAACFFTRIQMKQIAKHLDWLKFFCSGKLRFKIKSMFETGSPIFFFLWFKRSHGPDIFACGPHLARGPPIADHWRRVWELTVGRAQSEGWDKQLSFKFPLRNIITLNESSSCFQIAGCVTIATSGRMSVTIMLKG